MDVDFAVNCYERTYREVLAPGFIALVLAAQQQFPFSTITALVNNVNDRIDAERLAARAGVSRVVFVEDRLAVALAQTGLRPRHLARLPHFTDCCLVAATLDGPEWLAYWDAEATLDEPHDWITPSLTYMADHPEIAVANPDNWHEGLAAEEALRIDGQFAIGYGFSDVAFLARRSELRGRSTATSPPQPGATRWLTSRRSLSSASMHTCAGGAGCARPISERSYAM